MNERKLTKSELAKREDIIMKMKKNKRSLVQKYGKDAEAVMYGRATKLAKKQAESMDQDRIKELVKDALQNPKAADLNKDGKLSNYEKKRGAAIEKSMTNEMDRNDPIAMRLRTNKMKREKDAAKPKRRPLYGKQRQKVEDAILDIDQELKGIYSDKKQTLIDMEQEAEPEGGPIADRYGNELNKIENQIQSLIAKKDKLEARLDETKSIADLREISGDKMEALMELRNILDELQVLGDQAREIISMNFPSHLSRGEAYGAFDMGSSSNRYDTTLASIVADIEEYGEDEDLNEDLDLGHQDNEPHMLKADLYRIGKYAMELYQILDQFEGDSEEVDLPHWWQSKIIKSKDAIVGAKHYLDFEIKEPQIDAMVDVAQDVEAINEFDDESMTAYQKAVKKVYRPKYDGSIQMPSQEVVDAFFKKIGKEYHYLANKPVFGDLEPWDDYDYSNWKSITRGHKLNEADLDEARGPINLKAAMDALNKSKYVDGVKIRQGNKFTGIKSIEVNARLLGDLVVTKDGEVFWKHKGRTWGWDSPSIEHLIKTIEKLSAEEELNKQSPKNLSRTDVNEGVWSLGSAKSIKNIIGILDMALDIKDPQELMDLMDMHDKSMYNIVGDDAFHDDIDGAKRELAQNNLDRAYNRLIDAKGRAKDLLKIASENDLKDPSIFEGIAKKLAKQLKSK